ncbi:MAG: PTS cellobiose transporter subunit IIC [Eubacteriaceae bacterium]|jgi:PTS system cellobiose-specific IIC component
MSFYDKIEGPIMTIGEKINNIRFFSILRDSFMLAFPLTIFGSIMLIIANFPFMESMIGADALATLQAMLGPASLATMNVMSVWVAIGIGYYYSKSEDCDPIFGAAIALCAFFVVTPWVSGAVSAVDSNGNLGKVVLDSATVITTDRLGAKGMFVAMFGSFLSSYLYCFFTKKNWTIKMPEQVPPAVAKSFAALIPAFLTLCVFLLINIVFTFTPWGNVHDFIYKMIQAPLMGLGDSLGATVIAIFFVQLLWWFGLHGQILVNSVLDPIWNALMLENQAAFAAHQTLPHIVTKPFMETFTVGLGGSGATLIVVIMLAFFMKSKQMSEVGKLALPAGIFNVNEPVIFGLPIVLNPTIMIPWIIAPMLSVAIAYLSMAWGLVPYTTGVSVPWTVPVLLSGFLATNSWQGSILQLVQMAVVGVIWFPFLKAMDKQNVKLEQQDAVAEAQEA